jgi:hypothetical protein
MLLYGFKFWCMVWDLAGGSLGAGEVVVHYFAWPHGRALQAQYHLVCCALRAEPVFTITWSIKRPERCLQPWA